LRNFKYSESPPIITYVKFLNKNIDTKFIIALSLMLISNLGWIIPLSVIPWLGVSVEERAVLATGFIIFGQITYNIGLLMLGKKVINKLKKRKINFKYFWVQSKLLIHGIKKKLFSL